MNIMKIFFISFFLIFLFATTCCAADEPIGILQNSVDKFVSILSEKTDASLKAEKRQRIRAIIDNVFDFTEISRRALGRGWRLFNDEEKKEFIKVFSEFLSDTYIDKITGEYNEEKVNYFEQNFLNDERVIVKTLLIQKDTKVSIDYGMIKTDGTWKIYDIKVEGVSLINNYRQQFDKILLNKSPNYLIEEIKKKTAN